MTICFEKLGISEVFTFTTLDPDGWQVALLCIEAFDMIWLCLSVLEMIASALEPRDATGATSLQCD